MTNPFHPRGVCVIVFQILSARQSRQGFDRGSQLSSSKACAAALEFKISPSSSIPNFFFGKSSTRLIILESKFCTKKDFLLAFCEKKCSKSLIRRIKEQKCIENGICRQENNQNHSWRRHSRIFIGVQELVGTFQEDAKKFSVRTSHLEILRKN